MTLNVIPTALVSGMCVIIFISMPMLALGQLLGRELLQKLAVFSVILAAWLTFATVLIAVVFGLERI